MAFLSKLKTLGTWYPQAIFSSFPSLSRLPDGPSVGPFSLGFDVFLGGRHSGAPQRCSNAGLTLLHVLGPLQAQHTFRHRPVALGSGLCIPLAKSYLRSLDPSKRMQPSRRPMHLLPEARLAASHLYHSWVFGMDMALGALFISCSVPPPPLLFYRR